MYECSVCGAYDPQAHKSWCRHHPKTAAAALSRPADAPAGGEWNALISDEALGQVAFEAMYPRGVWPTTDSDFDRVFRRDWAQVARAIRRALTRPGAAPLAAEVCCGADHRHDPVSGACMACECWGPMRRHQGEGA